MAENTLLLRHQKKRQTKGKDKDFVAIESRCTKKLEHTRKTVQIQQYHQRILPITPHHPQQSNDAYQLQSVLCQHRPTRLVYKRAKHTLKWIPNRYMK